MITRRDAIIGRAFGIGAALAYGISAIFIKQGVSGMAPPLVGAVLSLFAGTLALTIIGARNLTPKLIQDKKAIGFLFLSGFANSLGLLSSYFALTMNPVVIVVPLQSTHPLFILLWGFLFLGRMEKITPRLILGSVLVVSGVALITIGGTI